MTIEKQLEALLRSRKGHFLTESGHHTDNWYDIGFLFKDLDLLSPIVSELGKKLLPYNLDIVCGPEDGGARVAKMISNEFGFEYINADRIVTNNPTLSKPSIRYLIPESFHDRLKDKKIAIVDDIINAGVATKATFRELVRFSATPVVVSSLLVKGKLIYTFAAENKVSVETIANIVYNMWLPQECPLCAKNYPIEKVF